MRALQLALILLVALLSTYFLAATFLPRLRLRWGRMTEVTLYPRGVGKARYKKPRMGGLSCFGTGLFFAAFPIFFFGMSVPPLHNFAFLVGFGGFILGIIGQFRDRALEGQGWERYKAPKNEN